MDLSDLETTIQVAEKVSADLKALTGKLSAERAEYYLLGMAYSVYVEGLGSLVEICMEKVVLEDDQSAIFRLFANLREVVAIVPQAMYVFRLVEWFSRHVERWLNLSRDRLKEWTANCIALDSWTPVADGEVLVSSSVVDMFTSFSQTLEFLIDLDWPDDSQRTRFVMELYDAFHASMREYVTQIVQVAMESIRRSDIRKESVMELEISAKKSNNRKKLRFGRKEKNYRHWNPTELRVSPKVPNIKYLKKLMTVQVSMILNDLDHLARNSHKLFHQQVSISCVVLHIQSGKMIPQSPFSCPVSIRVVQKGSVLGRTSQVRQNETPIFDEKVLASGDGISFELIQHLFPGQEIKLGKYKMSPPDYRRSEVILEFGLIGRVSCRILPYSGFNGYADQVSSFVSLANETIADGIANEVRTHMGPADLMVGKGRKRLSATIQEYFQEVFV